MEAFVKISNFTNATPALMHFNTDMMNTNKIGNVEKFDEANTKDAGSLKRPQHDMTTPDNYFVNKEGTEAFEGIIHNEEFGQKKETYKSHRGKRYANVFGTVGPLPITPKEVDNLDDLNSAVGSIFTKVKEIQINLKAEEIKADEDSKALVIFENMTDQLRQVKMNTFRALNLISLFHYYKNRLLEKKIAHLESKLQMRENLLNYSNEIMTALKDIPNVIYSSLDDSVNQWPQGTYALLKPSSGCPFHPAQKWEEGFYKIHTESSDYETNIDSYSENSHLALPVKLFIDSKHFMNISFCVKDTIHDGERPWPKGSYCINKKNDCPDEFSNGSIYLDEEFTDYSGGWGGVLPDLVMNKTFSFCCRNDASPSLPIKLPSFSPFYLYRFKGTCQEVIGMTAIEEYVHIDTDSAHNLDKLTFPHPDGQINNVNTTLCYYEPLMGNLGREK